MKRALAAAVVAVVVALVVAAAREAPQRWSDLDEAATNYGGALE